MKTYKPPLLSKIALWVANRLPNRVWAACVIGGLHMIDENLVDMEIHDKDGTITLCNGINEIQIENIRRGLWRKYLKTIATEDNK